MQHVAKKAAAVSLSGSPRQQQQRECFLAHCSQMTNSFAKSEISQKKGPILPNGGESGVQVSLSRGRC